jgi:hypothetical protein
LTQGARKLSRESAHCGGVAAMTGAADHLPDETDALKAALIETRAKLVGAQALIEHLQLVIGNHALSTAG